MERMWMFIHRSSSSTQQWVLIGGLLYREKVGWVVGRHLSCFTYVSDFSVSASSTLERDFFFIVEGKRNQNLWKSISNFCVCEHTWN